MLLGALMRRPCQVPRTKPDTESACVCQLLSSGSAVMIRGQPLLVAEPADLSEERGVTPGRGCGRLAFVGWGPLTQAGPGTATWPQTVANSTPLGQLGPVASFSAREYDSDPSCKGAPVKAGMTSSPKEPSARRLGRDPVCSCSCRPLGNWQAVGTQSGAAECQRREQRITPPTLVARGPHSPGSGEPGRRSFLALRVPQSADHRGQGALDVRSEASPQPFMLVPAPVGRLRM